MTMPDQYDFVIVATKTTLYDKESTCALCNTKYSVGQLGIYDLEDQGLGICNLCAWEKAPTLASLLYLFDAAETYNAGSVPAKISEALQQRKNDPERLKKELQKALDSLDNHGHGAPVESPLAKLVAEQIAIALQSRNVETMKHAKRLFEESRNVETMKHGNRLFEESGHQVTDDIPF